MPLALGFFGFAALASLVIALSCEDKTDASMPEDFFIAFMGICLYLGLPFFVISLLASIMTGQA